MIPLKQILENCTFESSEFCPACQERSCRSLLMVCVNSSWFGRRVPISVTIPCCLQDSLMLGEGHLRIAKLCSLLTHPATTEGAQMFHHKMSFVSWRSKGPPITHQPYHVPGGILGKQRIKVINRDHTTDE